MRSIWSYFRRESGDSQEKSTVMIWAPSCDILTRETASWASGLKIPRGVKVDRLIGTVSRRDIADSLTRARGRRATVCFLGHGLDHALIGYPLVLSEGTPSGDMIYDSELFDIGPRYLFAYCCKAGKSLGPNFVKKGPRAFLGFSEEIGICVTTESSRRTWTEVLQGALERFIEDDAITAHHRDELSDAYEQLFWFYQTGDGSSDEDKLLIQMYLVGQQEALVFFQS